MSEPNFKLLLDEFVWDRYNPDTGFWGYEVWQNYTEKHGYEWTDGMPKAALWVKLNPDITD